MARREKRAPYAVVVRNAEWIEDDPPPYWIEHAATGRRIFQTMRSIRSIGAPIGARKSTGVVTGNPARHRLKSEPKAWLRENARRGFYFTRRKREVTVHFFEKKEAALFKIFFDCEGPLRPAADDNPCANVPWFTPAGYLHNVPIAKSMYSLKHYQSTDIKITSYDHEGFAWKNFVDFVEPSTLTRLIQRSAEPAISLHGQIKNLSQWLSSRSMTGKAASVFYLDSEAYSPKSANGASSEAMWMIRRKARR